MRSSTWPICSKTIVCTILLLEDNNSSYNQAMWVLVSVLIAVLVVIIAVWFGIKLSLIAPMNRLIESIRHIASGDLVKPIDVEGSNEMGQLADNLRHMQSELVRTVGDGAQWRQRHLQRRQRDCDGQQRSLFPY
ncbi:Methyl-accepting chemotaxis protein II [Salmonella enterica subsp. enterica]|nr:Methyl-accepting chemotaxis protein II [Salmonella enterica subsp. enterica]